MDAPSSPLEWIACDGGPHLLLPLSLRDVWCGTEAPRDGRVVEARFRWTMDLAAPASDYDAACDVADAVGVIAVAGHQAVVLGDEVPLSTWLPCAAFDGGVLVVVHNAGMGPVDATVRAAAALLTLDHFGPTGLTFMLDQPGCVLCAACDAAPDWTCRTQVVDIPAGRYALWGADIRMDDVDMVVHGLERLPG